MWLEQKSGTQGAAKCVTDVLMLGFKQLTQTFIDRCNKTSTGNSHIVTLAYFVFCYTRMTQMLFYSLFQANEAFKFVMQRKSTGKVLIKTR